MITLVGIGHVFSIKDAVRYIIYTTRPQAVCLELDKIRFEMLEKGNLGGDDSQFIAKVLHRLYEKAASVQGASVGEEMLGGAEAAKALEIPYFLIDIEAAPIVSGLLKDMSLGQKMKLLGSVVGASVVPKGMLEKELKVIEEDPVKAMEQFEKVFPDLKVKLVDQRDRYMAGRIMQISRRYPDVLVVVGEGHIRGIQKLLEAYQPRIIHLKEVNGIAKKLMDGTLKMPRLGDPSGNASLALSFEMKG